MEHYVVCKQTPLVVRINIKVDSRILIIVRIYFDIYSNNQRGLFANNIMFHFSYFLATEVILLAYGMDCNNTVPPKRSNIDGCYYLHLHYLLLHPLHLFFSKITLAGNLMLDFSFQAKYVSFIFTFSFFARLL